MRRLLLLRHAKSSWNDTSIPDHDRPLAPRGIDAAARLRAYLSTEDISVDLVLCSSARRTRETLDAIRPALGADTDVRVEDDLYGADADDLLRIVRAVDPPVFSLIVVGHNPGLQDLAVELAGDGDPEALEQLAEKFPTGALAIFELGSTDWEDLGPGTASLTRLVLPRQLPAG